MEASCSERWNALVLFGESIELRNRLVLSVRGNIKLREQQGSRFELGVDLDGF